MSEPTVSANVGSSQLRTLAVRIAEDLRAQLDIVAQLTGRSATEEICLALEYWIDKTKADPSNPDRAELITWAFVVFATGEGTLRSLADELETRGLTTRRTRNCPHVR